MLRFEKAFPDPRSPSLHTESAGTAPPDAFGPFRVVHQIGAGTLGPVFRAYEPGRERFVAVKVFRLELPPERVQQLVEQFERLIAADLAHPAIASPIAAGISGGSAYLACDYITGESFDLALREYGPAPAADALRVAAQLAGALDFAAVVNIHHGGLHPRDVLLSSEETRLTGIGIARALEHIGIAAPVRRPYAAPERLAGAGWDRRADVFSLAALMHELVWGRRIAATGAQAADALTEIPEGDLPALKSVFARGLADNAADRFETALDFAEALKNAFPGVALVRPARREEAPPAVVSATATQAPVAPAEPPLPLSDPEPMPPLPIRAQGDTLPIAAEIPAIRDRQPTIAEPRPPRVESRPAIHEPPPTREQGAAGYDLDLREAEAARYEDVEVAPAIVPDLAPASDRDISAEPVPAATRIHRATESRSASAALIVMLIVGLAVGFGGAYLLLSRGPGNASALSDTTQETTPTTPGDQTAPAATVPAGREFTESAVPEPSRPAPAVGTPTPAPAVGTPTPSDPRRVSPRPPSSAPVAPPPPAANPNPGRLLVRSTPAGATVFVDGREVGETPVAARDLTNGMHRVRIERSGYVPVERRVVITNGRPSQSLTVALDAERAASRGASSSAVAAARPASRFSGALAVDSRPEGARVFVDNRLVGTTPLMLPEVRAGEHAVRLEHDGYRRWTSMVRVIAGERNRVTASLER